MTECSSVEQVYLQLEDAADGIVDLKLKDDEGDEPVSLIRVRCVQNVVFDGRWHALKVGDNFEVSLEK